MSPNMVLIALVVVAIGGVAFWAWNNRRESSASVARDRQHTQRISLLTEAIGYIGTILVLAGISVAVGQRWDDIPTGGRLAILGSATVILLGIGWLIRGAAAEPVLARLLGVTWAVSVATFAGCAAVVNQFYETSDKTAFVTTATSTAVYAGLLWLLHRSPIQHVVTFATVLVATGSVITRTVSDPEGWVIAVPLWAIGVAWAAAGWRNWLLPQQVAVPIGLLVALIAPSTIDNLSALRFGLGLGTAAAVMAGSVVTGFTLALALGSIAMFSYVVGSVTYYFGGSLGAPASLAIAGIVILAIAAAAARWHWFGAKRPPHLPPAASGSSGELPDHRRVA